MVAPVELSTVLLGQWQQAPRLMAVIDGLGSIQTDFHQALTDMARMGNLDDAEGIWLDRIGIRIGLRRPATTDPTLDQRFGFDQAGVAFDQEPFLGRPENDAVYPLGDDLYRKFIRARGVTVLSDGTLASLVVAIRHIDPHAGIQDRRDRTIRIVTAHQDLIQLADQHHAIPRTAGTMFVYAGRNRFGFDQAGVAFDQGPFDP